jgi:hypothetical protein
MVLTDSLISGPIPNNCHCMAVIHPITTFCLTISRNKCNSIFTLEDISELVEVYGDMQRRTLLPFCPAKAAVGDADA